jgi:hypothetical protein
MIDHFNPATRSFATRFRPPPPEILISTPIIRNRPNPSPFNHLIFPNRYKKPPPVTTLQQFIRIFFSGESGHPMRMAILSESAAANESKGPTRRGSVSRLLALSVPNVSRAKPCTGRHRAKPRTEWCRAKSRGSALHLELSGKARLLPQPRGHPLPPLLARTFPSS